MQRIILSLLTGCLLVTLFSGSSPISTASKPVNQLFHASAAYASDTSSATAAADEATLLYNTMDLEHKGLSIQVLEYALKGYNYLQKNGHLLKRDVLSICDFSQSSANKRLYIIDMDTRKLVLNTYVAHGKNSGAEYAQSFSNDDESLKSSLGFYVTRNTYSGSHGLSLRIDGLEKGFNDKASERNIVVHGCDYLGLGFLRYQSYNGRSWGCPAVPASQTPLVINTIKDGSCLFIYHPTQQYLGHSKILNS